jgi:TolB-like protein
MSAAITDQRTAKSVAQQRLNSWKEIATYLQSGVRTVRRWESQEGLPVQRHLHGKRGTVYAFAHDIDAWLKRRSVSRVAKHPPELFDRLATEQAHHRGRNRPLLIAILPLRTVNGDPQQERFADGLTQELILETGHCCPDRLRVIALTSVMQYKNSSKSIRQIGQELGVDYVLEGFIRRYGLRLRLTARLIAARDQAHIWADTYEVQLPPIFSLQQALARKVADSLAMQLHAKSIKGRMRRRTVPDASAHSAYIEGNSHFMPADGEIKKSIEDLNLAIDRDPKFAPSYAQLALTYFRRLFLDYPPIVTLRRIQELASKALKLDPKLARARTMLAAFELFGAWNWVNAEANIRQAIKVNPSDAWAWVVRASYRIVVRELPEAIEDLKRAHQLNPKCQEQGIWFATLAYLARHYDFAVERCQEVLDLDSSMIPAHAVLGLCYAQTGEHALALSHCDKVRKFGDGTMLETAQVCSIYALVGERESAEGLLEKLTAAKEKQYARYIFLAHASVCLRKNQQTLDWLHKAYVQRDPLLVFLEAEPRFDPLSQLSRFRSLLRLIGLPRDSEIKKAV